MRTRHLVICMPALLALGCAPRGGGPAGGAEPGVAGPAAIERVFPSGLRVRIEPDPRQGAVVASTVIAAGSLLDPPGKEGLAHLVEHLCFRARSGDARVIDRLKEAGGDFNAWTRDDDVQFIAIVPRDAADDLLALELRRLADPLAGLDEGVLVTEREVVRSELWSRPLDFAAVEVLKDMLFPPGHPYRRRVRAAGNGLASLTLDDARAFVAAHYRPAHATLVLSGPIDPAAIEAAITGSPAGGAGAAPSAIPTAPARAAGDPPNPPAPQVKEVRRLVGPVVSATVVLGWSLPGDYRDNRAVVEVTVAAMQGALRSLLLPQAGSASPIEDLRCHYAPGERASIAVCSIEVVPGEDPQVVARKAIDGIYQLWNTREVEWQASSFQAARAARIAELHRHTEPRARVEEDARHLHYTGHVERLDRQAKETLALDDHAIRAFAYKWFPRQRVVTLVIEPEAPDAPQPALAFDSGYAWPGATLEEPAVSPEILAATPESLAKRARIPDLRALRDVTLPNGLRVVMLPRPGARLTRVALLTGGGHASAVPWGAPDFAFATHRAGSPLAFGGAWVSQRFPEVDLVGIDAPSGRAADALALLLERVRTTHSVWERKYFDVSISTARRRVGAAERRPETWAFRALWNGLMPDHPLGSAGYDVSLLRQLDREDYESWLRQTLAPRNATLIVVGEIDPAALEGRPLVAWGRWRRESPGAAQPAFPPAPSPPPPRIHVVDRAGPLTGITAACQVNASTPESAAALEVLEALLKETLWSSVRDHAGASYGVEVSSLRHRGGASVLVVRTHVQNAKAPEAVHSLVSRIREIAAAGEDPSGTRAARLARIRWILARRSHVEDASTTDTAARLTTLVRLERPLDDLVYRPRRMAATTPEQLHAVLEPCAGHEIVTVVGPASELQERIDGLSLD